MYAHIYVYEQLCICVSFKTDSSNGLLTVCVVLYIKRATDIYAYIQNIPLIIAVNSQQLN